MAESILKLLSIYAPEMVLWIVLPLGASVLFILLTQHLVSRSSASRFSQYPAMRKVIDRSLIRHSRWVAKTSFAFFFFLFLLVWGLGHGAARYHLAENLVSQMSLRAAQLAPEGQEFSISEPVRFQRIYQKRGDKSLTAYSVLGVEYYRVVSTKTGRSFEVILPRDLSSESVADAMQSARFFKVNGEPGYFSYDTISAIRASLNHPVRLQWFLIALAFLSALPVGIMIATGLTFALTYPASVTDRFWRKQLVRILQRRVRALIEYGSVRYRFPGTQLRIAHSKRRFEYFIVRLPRTRRRKAIEGRIIDLMTSDTPLAMRLVWRPLRLLTLAATLGRIHAFGFVFIPEITAHAQTHTGTQKKLAYL